MLLRKLLHRRSRLVLGVVFVVFVGIDHSSFLRRTLVGISSAWVQWRIVVPEAHCNSDMIDSRDQAVVLGA